MPSEASTFAGVWEHLGPRLTAAVSRPGRAGRPVLVGVDGRSGAGKTDLTDRLAAAVRAAGHACVVVHLDDVYPGWDGLAAALEPLCSQVVGPLRSGRPGRYRSWDWHASRPGPLRDVPPAPVVVVEGVGVLASPCAADLDLRLWLEAPREVRRERALARDGEVFEPHWDRWAEQEDALFPGGAPPAADVVVDTLTGRATWDRLVP